MAETEVIMTIEEVSEYLQIPKSTLYSWSSRREGPPCARTGKHLRYRLAAVNGWLREREHRGDGTTAA